MAKFLIDSGMKPTIPEGGYFMLADWSPLGIINFPISKVFLSNYLYL